MGLLLTHLRAAGRLEAPSTSAAATAPPAARGLRIAPALAVRAGVDASPGDAAEQQQQQQQQQWPPRSKREKRPPPPRPTHFLALQVSQSDSVTSAISAVQQSLVAHSPHLRKACVDAASAHLTLGVMALPGEADRQRAAEVLAALAAPLAEQQLLAPLEIQLEGLSTFKGQVLYFDVRRDEGLQQLTALAAASRAHFAAAGLLLEGDRPFVAHCTIAKSSKLQFSGGGGGSRGRGGRGRGHGRDWREERRAKQQRLEQQQASDSAALGAGAGEGSPASSVSEPASVAASAAAEASSGAGQQNGIAGAAAEQHGQGGASSWRQIAEESYAPQLAIQGGPALLADIQLCAMQGRLPGQYYPVIATLPLAPAAPAAPAAEAAPASEDHPA